MRDPDLTGDDCGTDDDRQGPPRRWAASWLVLAAILMVAAGLRLWRLDRTSLWYDEVVTVRVAQAESPAAMIERLDQLDGTRAPLHPLVLHAWLSLCGSSDVAGRSFSVLCGVATVAVVLLLGRHAFDERAGCWAAWLAAVCPPLVYYSQEARMYAWLVLLTSVSWLVFLSFRRADGPMRRLAYGVLLVSLVYSHPLGLFMIVAHGLAFLLVRPALRLHLRHWMLIECGVMLAILPWLGRYLDHGTDYALPRYPIRFLLAVPIEYIGGNSLVLLACLVIIGAGLLSVERLDGRRRLALTDPVENLVLITWAAVPPVLMYVYSCFAQPIFGPARYHLFSAPAYLILVAHGLTRLPPLLRWPAATCGLILSLSLLRVYSPVLKADWRGLAAWLREQDPRGTTDPVTVVVHPGDPRFPREPLAGAQYYLSPRFRVVLAGESTEPIEGRPTITYEVTCLPRLDLVDPEPGARAFPGLVVKAIPP
jgi:4-amino-4-deoxy-L-arabinose transferase-like glycosyltransferase